MKIGDKIRSLRIIKGYSQENMADILGISSIAYGDIEVIRLMSATQDWNKSPRL